MHSPFVCVAPAGLPVTYVAMCKSRSKRRREVHRHRQQPQAWRHATHHLTTLPPFGQGRRTMDVAEAPRERSVDASQRVEGRVDNEWCVDGVCRLLRLTQNKTFMYSRNSVWTPLQQRLVDERQECLLPSRIQPMPAVLSSVTVMGILRPNDGCGATKGHQLRCGGDSSTGRSTTEQSQRVSHPCIPP